MIESERHDDSLDALLRGSAPEPLADDGFVVRTMTAVDQANRSLPAPRRAAPMAPIAVARALVAERQGQARRARQWRWAIAGAIGGYALMLLAMATSPTNMALQAPMPWDWAPLAVLMASGAIWVAWRELRGG
jgi:peptidoglycan/LPS O-acetylase OafA/YrhL